MTLRSGSQTEPSGMTTKTQPSQIASVIIMKKISKGQALTESIIMIPVMVMIFVSIVWFARILITRQQLVTAARYGTDLILYTNLNEGEIRQEIRNYLTHHWIKGRKLEASKLGEENIKIKIEGYSIPDFNFDDLMNPARIYDSLKLTVEGLLAPHNHTSWVEISYYFEIPRILSFMSNSDKFYISGRSEVLAGTGCKGGNHRK